MKKQNEKLLNRGIELLRKGELQKAEELFEKLRDKEPDEPSVYLWLGNCAVFNGNLQKARSYFKLASDKGNNSSIALEAKRQLRALWFNQIVKFIYVNPPLLYLLIFAVGGYLLSMGLRFLGYNFSAQYAEFIAIRVILVFFFFWVIFLISSFIGNLAFSPESPPSARRSAKLAILLSAIAIIPANLLHQYGTNIKILAIGTNLFLASVALERFISWLGRKLIGQESLQIFQMVYRSSSDSNKN